MSGFPTVVGSYAINSDCCISILFLKIAKLRGVCIHPNAKFWHITNFYLGFPISSFLVRIWIDCNLYLVGSPFFWVCALPQTTYSFRLSTLLPSWSSHFIASSNNTSRKFTYVSFLITGLIYSRCDRKYHCLSFKLPSSTLYLWTSSFVLPLYVIYLLNIILYYFSAISLLSVGS